jgi:hypothetical protein
MIHGGIEVSADKDVVFAETIGQGCPEVRTSMDAVFVRTIVQGCPEVRTGISPRMKQIVRVFEPCRAEHKFRGNTQIQYISAAEYAKDI